MNAGVSRRMGTTPELPRDLRAQGKDRDTTIEYVPGGGRRIWMEWKKHLREK